jgi:PAS domain S-box-containing protein
VILDLLMPHKSGYDVMSELATIDCGAPLPVLVMTANPDELERALLAGARDFVAKPIRAVELKARVRNLLDMRFALKALERRGAELETALGQRTASLMEAEQRFRAVVEQSIAGIYIAENGVWNYVNPRLCEILGYSASEMVGRPTIEFVMEEDREAVQVQRDLAFSGAKSSFSDTFRFRRKDGEVVHLSLDAKYIHAGGRKTFLGVAQDVSEQLRSLARVREAEEQRSVAVARGCARARRSTVPSGRRARTWWC